MDPGNADQLKQKLSKPSRRLVESLSAMACSDKALLEALLNIALTPDDRECGHAAWVVNHVSRKDHHALAPYVTLMARSLRSSGNESQMMSLIRALAETEFSLEENGDLVDICFSLISGERPVAIRAYSLMLLKKIVEIEPQLGREAILVLEHNIPYFNRPYLAAKARELIAHIRHQQQ